MCEELLLREEAGAIFRTAELWAQEEVLHVDDDEGGFGWVEGYGFGGGFDTHAGRNGRGFRCGGVGEVEACCGVVEPEGGGGADYRFAVGHDVWLESGTELAVLRGQRWWKAEIGTEVVGAQKSRRDALYPVRSV